MLAMMHPSHHRELDAIRLLWRASNHTAELIEARARLDRLQAEFPYVLDIGHEAVLVLEKLDDVDAAIAKLHALQRRFKKLDEETLCRWGKLLKKKGTAALAHPADHTQALHDFEEAGRFYARAFEAHRGFYPRINELSLQFLRAAIERDRGQAETAGLLLEDVRRKAARMLDDPEVWRRRKDDDHVWVPATKGEAFLLSRDWPQASARYRDALAAAGRHQFYIDCMRDQVLLLLDACRRLNIEPEHDLARPETFFPRRPAEVAS